MRSTAAFALLLAAACHRDLPPLAPHPESDPATQPLVAETPTPPPGKAEDPIPRVIRRLVAEERDLVGRSLALASELPDPRGRQRALSEAKALQVELDAIAAPIDGADSATLDAIASKLLLIDTRIALLHEALRTATSRTTAVAVD